MTTQQTNGTSKLTLQQIATALAAIQKEFPGQQAELEVGIKALRRIWKQLDGEESKVIQQAMEVVENATKEKVEDPQIPAVADAEEEEKSDNDHPASTIPNGFYTVTFPDKTHLTFCFKPHWIESEAAKGVQVAKVLTGPDNETSYTGVAFVDGTKVYMWKKYKTSTRIIHGIQFLMSGGSVDSGEMYAMKSGNCWKCNHKLTVPASLHRGLGPVCAKKLGLL